MSNFVLTPRQLAIILVTAAFVFLLGFFAGNMLQKQQVSQPVRVTPPANIPLVAEPVSETQEPTVCSHDIIECPDGSTTVRAIYQNCDFLSCSVPDGKGGDHFQIARGIFTEFKTEKNLVDSLDVAHVDSLQLGHVYQAVVVPISGRTGADIAAQFGQLLLQMGYKASPSSPQENTGVVREQYSLNDPIYHGFAVEQYGDVVMINFWWD